MVKSSYYKQARSEMFGFIPKGMDTALEVGCGSGFFGKALIESRGMEVWGIEKSKEAGSEAKNILSGVFIGTLEEFFISKAKNDSIKYSDNNSIFEKAFDCIIFNDVLEHMSDPWMCLNLSKSLLKNEGIIIASIPNIRYYRVVRDLIIGKDFKYVEKGVMDRSHLRFFTEKSIMRMFNECGYQVLKIEGINMTRKLIPKIINKLFIGSVEDILYPQFAIIAKAN